MVDKIKLMTFEKLEELKNFSYKDFLVLLESKVQRKDSKFDYKKHTRVLVYLIDNKPVGVLAYDRVSDSEYYISPVEVLEEYRRQGIGSKLVNQLKFVSYQNKRIQRITATSYCDHIDFYESLGFNNKGNIPMSNSYFRMAFPVAENKQRVNRFRGIIGMLQLHLNGGKQT